MSEIKNKKMKGVFGILISAFVMSNNLYASKPLWTFSAPNPVQVSLTNESTAKVRYTVINQSEKSKNLILKPTSGLSTSSCYLAQKGSTCILTLTIDGSKIPPEGLHSGPFLCEEGNPSQCYQPSAPNVLNAKLLSVPVDVNLSLSPTSFSFAQGGASQIVTITNNGPLDAYGVGISNAPGLGISVSGSCASPLAINENCQLTFISGSIVGNTTASISGTNTNTVTENITVTSAPTTSLSVSVVGVLPGAAVMAVNNPNGVQLSIENTGNTTAYNVMYSIPWSGVSTTGSCGNIEPGPANACLLTFVATKPNVVNTIGFSADNAPTTQSPTIAFSYQGFLVWSITSNTASVIYTVDSASTGSWDTSGCNTGQGTSTCVSIPGATDRLNGIGNTAAILSTIGTQNPPYETNAAGLCNNLGNGWYLPAICELGTEVSIQGPCFGLSVDNIYSNLFIYGFGGFTNVYYWSSTQSPNFGGTCTNDPGSCAWSFWLINSNSAQASTFAKSLSSRVRCANQLAY